MRLMKKKKNQANSDEPPKLKLVSRTRNWEILDSDSIKKLNSQWHDQKIDVFSQVQECRSNK